MKVVMLNVSAGTLVLLISMTPAAWAIDWQAVPAKEITLFYPGQTPWEWQLTQNDHSGAQKFREGKLCHECHNGEEVKMGDLLVSGKKAEPEPIKGKAGTVKLSVQMAHDGERIHVRLQWDATKADEKRFPDYQASVAMMFDDGTVKSATRAGCWGTCHDDLVTMPSAPAGKELTKYLAVSRTKLTRKGGDENYKPQAELDKLLAEGEFLEYWQAHLNPGQPPKPVSGYVLDKRHVDDPPVVSEEGSICTNCQKWTVVFNRPLKVSTPGHKDIVPGKTYTVGFAVHGYYTDRRFHYVSFEKTFRLDEGEADFIAKKM